MHPIYSAVHTVILSSRTRRSVLQRVKVGDSGEEIDLFQGLPDLMAPEAMMASGNDYLFGQGVPEDYQQAVTWYRKAVEPEARPP